MDRLWTPPPPNINRDRPYRYAGAGSKTPVGGFTPAALTGVGAWWDFSNTGDTTITSTRVSKQNDRLGGSIYLGNNPGGGPTITTLNGLAAASYPGNEGIRSQAISLTPPYSIWMVVRMTSTAGGNRKFMEYDGGQEQGIFSEGGAPGQWKLTSYSSAVYGSGIGLDNTTTHLVIGVFASASAGKFALDATQQLGINVGTPTTVGYWWVGYSAQGMTVGEAGYTTGAMSNTEMTNMRTYAAAKWGSP